jgi:hypothetical protein
MSLRLLPRDQQDHQRDRQGPQCSRSEKDVRLLLPYCESGAGIHTDSYINIEKFATR